MKFRKNWKRFWTLDRRHAEGFTLVELIVVIAILAILAGVGTVGYSGYVKKANMQADITLASEVAHALTLYYYSHPAEVTSGYVILTQEGKFCGYDNAGVGLAAMDAAFGDGWENNLSLKYDGWEPNSATFAALMVGSDATTIKNSEFAKASTSTLLNDVQTVVTAASKFLTGQGAEEKLSLVQAAVGGTEKLNALCNELGIDASTATDAELSNLLVFAVASNSTEVAEGTNTQTTITEAATNYAAYVAYAYANPDDETIQAAFQTMSNSLNSAEDTDDINAAFDAFKSSCAGWEAYVASNSSDINKNAFSYIMQAVDTLQPSLAGGNLNESDYFLNNNIDDQLDTYMAAVDMVAGWDSSDFGTSGSDFMNIVNGIEGGVVVFLYATSNGIHLDCTSMELLVR